MTGGVTASRCDSPWAGLVPQDYLEVAAGIKQAAMKMRRLLERRCTRLQPL